MAFADSARDAAQAAVAPFSLHVAKQCAVFKADCGEGFATSAKEAALGAVTPIDAALKQLMLSISRAPADSAKAAVQCVLTH